MANGLGFNLDNSVINRIIRNSTTVLAVLIIFAIVMIIIPIPALLLDFLMIINILAALVIIITVISSKQALDFSVFPTILVFTTIFRIAVNISSTRLILTDGVGFNGQVIKAFADFVVGGNYVIGVIIFIIITAFQFMVITKGATRVAEVSARFKLDSMPGKQMSIDADLNAGLIDERQAMQRRLQIQQEADFYGSMDGASKFVSGDVKAGIFITIVNIIGGLIVGIALRNEGAGVAARTYVSFAVGDGLVALIPSLLISVATGIIVTRAVSDESLGDDVSTQLLTNPVSFYFAAGFVGLLAFVPGFPTLVFLLAGGILGFLGYSIRKVKTEEKLKDELETEKEEIEEEEAFTPEKMVDIIHLDPLEVELGYGLIPLVDKNAGGDLLERIKKSRKQLVLEMGLIVPQVRITDNMQLEADEYSVKLYGDAVGGSRLMMNKLLAMNTTGSEIKLEAEMTTEPAFGLPAYWINEDEKEAAERKGYTIVDGPTIVATHLTELIKRNAAEIMGRKEVKSILDSVRKRNQGLIEELDKQQIKTGDVQKVLQDLLSEQISIRNINTILEVICDYGPTVSSFETLAEMVRSSLRRYISEKYADEGKNLHVMVFSPELGSELVNNVTETEGTYILNLNPDSLNTLIENIGAKINAVREKGYSEVLLTDPVLRRPLRKILGRNFPNLGIVSMNEIAEGYKIDVVESI